MRVPGRSFRLDYFEASSDCCVSIKQSDFLKKIDFSFCY
ncbi:hypothetical protein BGLA2_1340009 [Burkholderia gladioli]|nr:hypothetical protein BGLA2_1340009 [Burkholderia gladioli]